MERLNVVILEVDLNKGFPVVVTLVHDHPVELITFEIKRLSKIHPGQITADITRTRKK